MPRGLDLNGVPGPGDIARSRAAHAASSRIVFLGQIGERKGVPDLLAAFQTPRLLARSWTATVAGDGEVDEFRAAVAKAGLQDRVSMPRWVDGDPASDLLRESDIFVLPSHFEAMPIAILDGTGSRRGGHSHTGRCNPGIPDRRSDGTSSAG